MDQSNLLEGLIDFLTEHEIPFCVIGGQAVNAYVEPLVSLDLDLAVSGSDLDKIKALLESDFNVKQFPHSLNISLPASDLRIQIQTDPRYGTFVARAASRSVLGMELPVASLEDVLQGKVWAALDSERRASKRQKDLADIARILEAYPEFRSRVPEEIRARLVDE